MHPIIINLVELVRFLREHPYPVVPSIERLQGQPKKGRLNLDFHHKERKEYRAIKLAFREQLNYLSRIPPDFSNSEDGLAFFKKALAAEKTQSVNDQGIERIFGFFNWPDSPLAKAHLIPVSIVNTFESVSDWIERALCALQSYYGSSDQQIRSFLLNLLIKFVFESTFPHLDYRIDSRDAEFGEKLKGLVPENVSDECVELMVMAQFFTNPVECLTCLGMVLKVLECDVDNYGGILRCGVTLDRVLSVLIRADLRAKSFIEWLRFWSRLETVSTELIGSLSIFEMAIEHVEKRADLV
jgi:hypothetical protein